MKRKINRVGANTLTISLPTAWATQYNLKSGQELELRMYGSRITMEPLEVKSELKLSFLSSADFSRRAFFKSYTQGYDEVTIEYPDPEIAKKIHANLPLMLGFEIVSQTAKMCIIKNIAEGLDSEFDSIFNRFISIPITMGTEILQAVIDKNKAVLSSIITYEATADKCSMFCKRMINKKGVGLSTPSRSSVVTYEIISLFKSMVFNFRRIIEILDEDISISKRSREYFQKINALVIETRSLVFSPTSKKSTMLKNHSKEAIVEGSDLLSSPNIVDRKVISLLSTIAVNIYDLSKDF